MNCKDAQRKITESWAAGITVLPPEVAGHCRDCVACRAYYESERELFATIESGLQSVTNQPMPATLLPRIRVGMNAVTVRGSYGFPAWGFVAASAPLVLALSAGLWWNSSQRHIFPASTATTATANRTSPASPEAPLGAAIQPHSSVLADSAKRARHDSFTKASDAASEVIVLAEEREAYARYVADLAQEAQRPVVASVNSEQPDAVSEIALLQIKEVEIQPLEGTVED